MWHSPTKASTQDKVNFTASFILKQVFYSAETFKCTTLPIFPAGVFPDDLSRYCFPQKRNK